MNAGSPDPFGDEGIKNIIESLDQGILVTDLQGRLILWNSVVDQHFRIENMSPDKTLKALFPNFWEEYRGRIWGDILLSEIIQGGLKKKLSRFPLKTSNGKIRYFDLKGSPLRNPLGEIIGAVLAMNDVTDNIYLENQMMRQARTTSLADLGASIAHEIRNPLNSISLNIQLIKEWLDRPNEVSQEEMRETIGNVLSEIHRLNERIRYFLKFSRMQDVHLLVEDLNGCVQQVLKLLAEEARIANVTLFETLSPSLPNVKIDRNLLAQAIYNICLNGIQAMKPQGGGMLEVVTQTNSDYVLLEIKDNGPGLAPEVMDKLFNLFFTTKEDGTGLGLAIANQIGRAHV